MSDNCKYEYRPTIGHDAHGKPIRKSFYGKTKKAAKAKAEQWLLDNAIAAQTTEKLSAPLFNTVYDDYMAHKKATIRPNSYYQLKTQFRKIVEEFGDIPIDKIKHNDVVKYIDKLSETYSHNTVCNVKITLSGIFKYAVRCEYISSNPVEGINFRAKKGAKVKNTYTLEEAELVTEYSRSHPDGLAVDMMLSYGTTISETLGIRYESVDFTDKTVQIREGVTAVPGETVVGSVKNKYRIRTIAVTDETLEHIRRSHEQHPEYEYLITYADKDGPVAPWFFRNHIFNPFMIDMTKHMASKGHDIKILNPHELRHTRATLWIEQGVDLFAIAEEMGWSNLKMLREVYGHPDIRKLRRSLFGESS